jgi:hypothetical protein
MGPSLVVLFYGFNVSGPTRRVMGGHHPEVAGGYPSLLCHDWGRNPSQPDENQDSNEGRTHVATTKSARTKPKAEDGPQQHVTHNTRNTPITHITLCT